ncbi:hypothetical protein GGR54DRAFT_92074 [Hypoxylon sp. NC1633]|nr:hypothetical protein GGR54DRAFT_92074 [Hypoxylon sp. NC1633]
MHPLSTDLILSVAERLDVKSMLKLTETNKGLCSLIKSYERSLMVSRLGNFIDPPRGTVLSSEPFLRRPLQYASFSMVKELEKREFQIDDILKNSTYVNLAAPALLGALNLEQQGCFYALMKRAMSQCNRIADIAANSPCKPSAEQWYYCLRREFWEIPNLELGFRQRDPYTNYPARFHQRMYISSLPLEDVAMLFYLVNSLSLAFLNSRAAFNASDPAAFERATMFEDSILRHGSWFAWAHIRGDGEWRHMADRISAVGLVEITNYETGQEGSLPSLKSALLDRFKMLTGTGTNDNLIVTMRSIVKRMVTGFDESDEGEEDGDGDEDLDESEGEL